MQECELLKGETEVHFNQIASPIVLNKSTRGMAEQQQSKEECFQQQALNLMHYRCQYNSEQMELLYEAFYWTVH